MKKAFDNDLYLKMQSEQIIKRIDKFDNKLYLEFGGKLFDDYHASRVLPGFLPDSKLKMLLTLKDKVEIVIGLNAFHIEKNKVRRDLGISYEDDTLRLIDAFRESDLYVGSVVITNYNKQPLAESFANHLTNLGIKIYYHYTIEGYPNNISHIVSEEGFGKNDYIKTSRDLIVVTAPGPGSGKMAICLSQLYHEHKRNINAGYAKYETFPIWNLSLKHPINLAYEAATADLNDINMIDPFHLEAYNVAAVNYNRDVEIFPVLKAIFTKLYDHDIYQSPTDMGVNMVGYAIIDDNLAREASRKEIIRRYYYAQEGVVTNQVNETTVEKIQIIMSQADIQIDERKCIQAALDKAEGSGLPAFAIELEDGQIVTGKTSSLLGSAAAALLNALKVLGNIDDSIPIISPSIIAPIQHLKVDSLKNTNPRLHTDEILIALAISANTNPISHLALQQLEKLANCEAHSSVILTEVDKKIFRKLKVNLTCEPQHQTDKLYHKK